MAGCAGILLQGQPTSSGSGQGHGGGVLRPDGVSAAQGLDEKVLRVLNGVPVADHRRPRLQTGEVEGVIFPHGADLVGAVVLPFQAELLGGVPAVCFIQVDLGVVLDLADFVGVHIDAAAALVEVVDAAGDGLFCRGCPQSYGGQGGRENQQQAGQAI